MDKEFLCVHEMFAGLKLRKFQGNGWYLSDVYSKHYRRKIKGSLANVQESFSKLIPISSVF